MSKLSKTQQEIIETAAARPDGAILPPPETLQLEGRALKATLHRLTKRGLVAKTGKDKKPVITKAGRNAVAGGARQAKAGDGAKTIDKRPVAGVRPDSKQNRLLVLLSRPEGAGMADLMATTGWQAHSVRAALTGFRKRRIPVARAKDEAGVTVYRVAGA